MEIQIIFTVFMIVEPNPFLENFKGGQAPKPCPVCKEERSIDTQMHSFQCKVLADNIGIEGTYADIFCPKVDKGVAKTVTNIVKFREQYLDK